MNIYIYTYIYTFLHTNEGQLVYLGRKGDYASFIGQSV